MLGQNDWVETTVKNSLSKLYSSSPREMVHYAARVMNALGPQTKRKRRAEEIAARLKERFALYDTSNLKGITPDEFTVSIQSRIGVIDAQSEGYVEDEIAQQRDLSVKFHWGHNHDFGAFKLEGRMTDRHIRVLSNFVSLFPVSLEDFADRAVFDIGCWTGGTTLLLASLAGKVFAIEEVKKYAETASFLSHSFDLSDRVSVKPLSIYDCNSEEFHGQFDIAYFPGVIYHLSDPLLALRILFNSLRVGGFILVESAGIDNEEPLCRFDGSLVHSHGTKERLNRGGWNWFMPSPSALHRMMREAGFDEVETQWHNETQRVYAYGRKASEVGMCKAGLSVPGIK